MDVEILVKRKLTVTFFTTTVTSFILTFLYMMELIKPGSTDNLGTNFLGWLYVYSLYVGAIVLFYGNLISIGIEYLQKKDFLNHTWLYVLLHGFFGLANGLLFQELALAFYGLVVAVFYGFVDRWVYARMEGRKRIRMFFLIPILTCGLLWGYFQIFY